MDYISEFESTIKDVTTLLGKEISMSKIKIIDLGQPHIPQPLKDQTMAVYTFIYNNQFLKIGKAGPKTRTRFYYQHYNPNSANSTLAKSILSDLDMVSLGITAENVGTWIKENCRRIDIILDIDLGPFALELVEAVLHYKYEPRYEGHKTQR